MNAAAKQTTVLIVLDGWGYREETRDNAIANGNTPVWDRLWRDNPHTCLLYTSDAADEGVEV